MKLTLDPGAAALLDTLHAAGYAAYAVGGCVRDSLLGRTAHDWDLCTSALPQQVMELFGAEQCIPTGLQHGTVTIKYGGQLYETTTFRTEGSYTDGRHPDEVQFVPDVREDLARRDFTINAMAYNEAEGLVDPFGGQKDLQNGLLRAVGEPQQRFTEDALRILRLYRFAARFGFALDAATARAARQLAPHLDCISAERIQEELAKLLAAPQPGAYLEPAVLAVVLPELTPAALEAAKQSGRGIIPEIGKMTDLESALKTAPGKKILFYEGGGEALGTFVPPDEAEVSVFIGPEGGFDAAEVQLAKQYGATPATLGPRILRTETAPLAALSVLMYITGNMQ